MPEAGPVGPAPKKAKEDVTKTKKEEDRDEATDELNDANYDEVNICILTIDLNFLPILWKFKHFENLE